MFAHLSPSAAQSVYVCVRHPLRPTPALPPASRALRRAPSHPSLGRAASLLEKPRGAEVRAGHPLRGLRQPRTRGGTSWWDAELGPARGGYFPARGKGDRKPRAARSFRRRSRLAPGELAAGSKGRGPARSLTHRCAPAGRGSGPACGSG